MTLVSDTVTFHGGPIDGSSRPYKDMFDEIRRGSLQEPVILESEGGILVQTMEIYELQVWKCDHGIRHVQFHHRPKRR